MKYRITSKWSCFYNNVYDLVYSKGDKYYLNLDGITIPFFINELEEVEE